MSTHNRDAILKEMLSIIRTHPGIRASELNRKMNREHSWNYRKSLIEKGLVKKEKDGAAVRYYPL